MNRDPRDRQPLRVLALLVLASVTVMTLDARGGSSSPVQPLRSLAGNVVSAVRDGWYHARPWQFQLTRRPIRRPRR